MRLNAVREKLKAILIYRKPFLLTFLAVLLLIFFFGLIGSYLCLNSPSCLLTLSHSFPAIRRLLNVEETDLAYRRDGLTIGKEFREVIVSGEIVKVGNNSLTLKFEDGTERAFAVEDGSQILLIEDLEAAEKPSEEAGEIYIFDNQNLEEILSPGYYLHNALLHNGRICSGYERGGWTMSEYYILVGKSSK